MKPGVSFARTTPLPRRRSAKRVIASQRLRPGRRAGDHLQQPHVARRIEEMGDQEVAPEALRQVPGQIGQRDGRGVRGDDAARAADGLQPLVERLLGRRLLDDRLDDPVARRPGPRGRPRRLPGVTSLAASGVMNGAGSASSIRAMAPRASALRSPAPSGTMSSSSTGTPALAMCAAIPLPITPAPITAARRISIASDRLEHGGDPLAAADAHASPAPATCPRAAAAPPPCR